MSPASPQWRGCYTDHRAQACGIVDRLEAKAPTVINILMFALALALASPGASAQTPTPVPTPNPDLVRVFVETDVGGQASELAGRRQSVKDLAAALASKKKTMVLVDREDNADLVLEVLSRGVTVPKVVFGLGPKPGEPIGMSGPVRVVVLRVQLTFGLEVLSFANKNKPAEAAPGWKSAADDIADQVAKWAAEHHAEILKQRARLLGSSAAGQSPWRKIPTS